MFASVVRSLASAAVIVTNHHVMKGAYGAVVTLASGERYERVAVLDDDPAADLAILKIPGYGLPTLQPTSKLPPVGAKVVVIGNPLGLAQTVTEGIVSAVRLIDGHDLLQMSAAISPGSSGGPVLNTRGEVVAVATATLTDGQSLNFATPVRYAMGLVESPGAPMSLAARFGETASPGRSSAASDATPTASSLALSEGVYAGTVINARFPESPASLRLEVLGGDDGRRGDLVIGPPLGGSGPYAALWSKDSLFLLTASPTGDTIAWSGRAVGDTVDGRYVVVGGPFRMQYGTWAVFHLRGRAIARGPILPTGVDRWKVLRNLLALDQR